MEERYPNHSYRYCDVLTLERMAPLEEGLKFIEERYITLFDLATEGCEKTNYGLHEKECGLPCHKHTVVKEQLFVYAIANYLD